MYDNRDELQLRLFPVAPWAYPVKVKEEPRIGRWLPGTKAVTRKQFLIALKMYHAGIKPSPAPVA